MANNGQGALCRLSAAVQLLILEKEKGTENKVLSA
jgi:hypothetical protein